MRSTRYSVVVLLVGLLTACGSDAADTSSATSSSATSSGATSSGEAGRILFQRAPGGEVVGDPETDVYLVNADGSEGDVELLFADGQPGRWSPDGTEVTVFCCDEPGMVAHVLDVATSDVRGVETPDPTLELHCGGWSPDGERLVCEGYGMDDQSRNGIYSVRASDGGALMRITSNPAGSDVPGDYSPDGTQLVFKRFESEVPTGIFVVDIGTDGAGVGEPRQLTPAAMRGDLDDTGHAGSWSPDGETILFVAQPAPGHHKAIYSLVIGAEGEGTVSELPIAPGCGGPAGDPDAYGCYAPAWSPDGDRIVFTRSEPYGADEKIWIVNADGSDLLQVTEGTDDSPVWGPPPSPT